MTFIITRPWSVYNEIEPYAAEWIENLIARGCVAPGVVDRRSIEDVRPDDYRGFRQVHLFAGIAVWSYSLRRAGVSDDTALWTGSCPCQGFSQAGQGRGVDDERHLWPHAFWLIEKCRPPRFFGEQVASKDGLGWLDLVQADMEGAGYAFGALDTCSAGHGAPHIRQRLRIAAYDTRLASVELGNTKCFERNRRRAGKALLESREIERIERSGDVDGLGNSDSERWISGSFGAVCRGEESTRPRDGEPERSGDAERLDNNNNAGLEGFGNGHSAEAGHREGSLRPVATAGGIEWVADSNNLNGDRTRPSTSVDSGKLQGSEGLPEQLNTVGMADQHHHQQRAGGDAGSASSQGVRPDTDGCRNAVGMADDAISGRREERAHPARQLAGDRAQGEPAGLVDDCGVVERIERPGPVNGHWRDADWLFCRDGKWRPVSASSQQMAHGSTGSVGFSSSFPLIDGAVFKKGSGHPVYEGKSRQGMLKGYGNAIDAEATKAFLEAYFEFEAELTARNAMASDFDDVLA